MCGFVITWLVLRRVGTAEIRLLGLQLGFQLSLIPQATVHYCPPLSCIHWEEEQLLLAKTSSARLWGGNSLNTHTSPPRRLVALFPWRKVKPGEKAMTSLHKARPKQTY